MASAPAFFLGALFGALFGFGIGMLVVVAVIRSTRRHATHKED